MVLWARVLLGSRLFLINILPIIIMTIGLSYFFTVHYLLWKFL
ncbi:hypothetical protein X474_17195 [Dethiosulfatarculus sandiegensis]|uniref:Uncharacterized protein n=1 Tax=Dethiosulfatarculus sandiegensis TaxID=1429043 RepID=A0A0D2GCZ7_9BACT|nr:hypothetical protein X474_17195 [Dethiosulfatarculus sandiegensis]